MKRRRWLVAFVTATAIVLCWYYRRSADLNTPSQFNHPHGKGKIDPVKVNGIGFIGPTGDGREPSTLKYKESYPVSSLIPLPSGRPASIPKIQFSFSPEDAEISQVREERLAAVREAFLHSWTGYRKYAWRKDELAPLTGGYRTTFSGWAATLVDSLDTLWIMGLEGEFNEAVGRSAEIDFNKPASLPINVFETTIRYLGGFLGAYDISEGRYHILLEKAREVGEVGWPMTITSLAFAELSLTSEDAL